MSTAFISCPADPAKTLGIKLPFLVMIIKNLNKYFTFEVPVRRPGRQRGCCACRGQREGRMACAALAARHGWRVQAKHAA